MGFYACSADAIGALECQWQENLSRSSDLNEVLPLLYPKQQAISDYKSRLNVFKETQGTSGLGVLQYLNLRLEQAVTDYIEGESNTIDRLSDIADVLDESAFHTLSDDLPTEPVISVSTIPQFNEYVKNITMSDAELLLLDAKATHHWKRTVKGALVILREFCPEALNTLSGRHIKIIPVVSPRPNLSLSASNEFVSATITASWVTPKECAEMLLHEMGHSLLADILSTTELWSANPADLYYSPFREDARPIDGLLHAAYSFHNVCIYKFTLATNAKGRLMSWARRTLESDLLRTLVCVRILSESGDLTERGNALVKTIGDDLSKTGSQLDWEIGSTAISMLRKHCSDWLTENGSVPEHSCDLASRVVDEVIDECVSSKQSKKSDWHLKKKKKPELTQVRNVEFLTVLLIFGALDSPTGHRFSAGSPQKSGKVLRLI